MVPLLPIPKKLEVAIAVGTAEPPVPFAITVPAACAASCVSASEPEIFERVEVGAAYTFPFASTPNPEFVRPVIWRLVVVALVVEERVAKRLEKVFCALKVFAVVVPNAVEMVIAPVAPVVRSG
jgi:hypothetical protein